MVPVSVRSGDETDAYQNRVSALLADLATNEADPVKRLRRVQQSMTAAKENFTRRSRPRRCRTTRQFAPPAIAARAMRMYSRLRIADRDEPAVQPGHLQRARARRTRCTRPAPS